MSALRVLGVGFLLAASVSCRVGIDPNSGIFSCGEDADCGEGYECRTQAAGGGLCFVLGTCSDVEQCDGRDDNCDGRVDESFPEEGQTCETTRPGFCLPGQRACAAGALFCKSQFEPTVEYCDDVDNDCDGETDEDFNFSSDPLNCSGCNRPCPTGNLCVGGVCHEGDCADGIDNDTDGQLDCADDDCLGRACSASFTMLNCGRGVPALGPDGGLIEVDGGTDAGELDAGDADAGAGDAGELDAGELDAGDADAGAADAGEFDGGADAGPADCVFREVACGDGADDDGDGQTDCADPDCDQQTCASGTLCAAGSCPDAG